MCVFDSVPFYLCLWGKKKKIAHTAPALPGASDALIAANGDLKRKLDYFVSF